MFAEICVTIIIMSELQGVKQALYAKAVATWAGGMQLDLAQLRQLPARKVALTGNGRHAVTSMRQHVPLL